MQYEAADVTELYHYQMQLQEKNDQLSEMLERQKALLQSIVENNLKKEVLHTKMRIHSDFGRVLVMTENRLTNRDESEGDTEIFAAWDHVITDMENASLREETVTASPQNELLKMAEMIGCKVEFIGEQPTERRALLLLYAAIREALTNAVRHAGADRLIVEIRHDERCCRVTIASNGRTGVTSIQEGGGLSDLRRRLEQEGASLLMEINNGVVMHVTIPVGENG
jgi:nitrate/nitrite-specific signal transduction histidine kinase